MTNYYSRAVEYISEIMRNRLPNVNIDSGSAANAILVRAGAMFLEPIMQELDHVRNSRDLSSDLADADVDRILGNLLVERDAGARAFGFVNLYYRDRKPRTIASGLIAVAGDLTFETTMTVNFAAHEHKKDIETGEFYLVLPMTASKPGVQYNVEAGAINSLVNDVSGASSVKNSEGFSGGKEKESNEDAIADARAAVSTRTPWNLDGCKYWLKKKFKSSLLNVEMIGHGDPLMIRDEVRNVNGVFEVDVDLGASTGIHVGGRTDVYILFDGVEATRQIIDVYADMTIDSLSVPTSNIIATFVPGTTGTVASSGVLIIDSGNLALEETCRYSSYNTNDGNTYNFFVPDSTEKTHQPGASVKVVNNESITVGVDIPSVPVYILNTVTKLDPITFSPSGEIKETTKESRTPGWRWENISRYSFLSAKEAKILILDEKRDVIGNQGQEGLCDITVSSDSCDGNSFFVDSTPPTDFTGCVGRDITIDGVTCSIARVDAQTRALVLGDIETGTGVQFSIDSMYGDYIGNPIQLDYYSHPQIKQAQEFFDSDANRASLGNMLAREPLPVFLDFHLKFSGSTATEEGVKRSIYETIRAQKSFDYSDIINAAYIAGADYVETPFTVIISSVLIDGTTETTRINIEDKYDGRIRCVPDVTSHYGDFHAGSVYVSGVTQVSSVDIGRDILLDGDQYKIVDSDPLHNTMEIFPAAKVEGFYSFLITTNIISIEHLSDIPESGKITINPNVGYTEEKTFSKVFDNSTILLDSLLENVWDAGVPVTMTSYTSKEHPSNKITLSATQVPEFRDVVIEKL